jgi:hypothetical protein
MKNPTSGAYRIRAVLFCLGSVASGLAPLAGGAAQDFGRELLSLQILLGVGSLDQARQARKRGARKMLPWQLLAALFVLIPILRSAWILTAWIGFRK